VLNAIDFDNLNDLLDKYLKITVNISKASDVPAKSAHKTMVSYEWIDD